MSNTGEKGNKIVGMAFRCRRDQANTILEAAGLEGVDYSTFVRNSALAIAKHVIKTKGELKTQAIRNYNDEKGNVKSLTNFDNKKNEKANKKK